MAELDEVLRRRRRIAEGIQSAAPERFSIRRSIADSPRPCQKVQTEETTRSAACMNVKVQSLSKTVESLCAQLSLLQKTHAALEMEHGSLLNYVQTLTRCEPWQPVSTEQSSGDRVVVSNAEQCCNGSTGVFGIEMCFHGLTKTATKADAKASRKRQRVDVLADAEIGSNRLRGGCVRQAGVHAAKAWAVECSQPRGRIFAHGRVEAFLTWTDRAVLAGASRSFLGCSLEVTRRKFWPLPDASLLMRSAQSCLSARKPLVQRPHSRRRLRGKQQSP